MVLSTPFSTLGPHETKSLFCLAGLRKEDIDGSDAAVYVGSFVKGRLNLIKLQIYGPNLQQTMSRYAFVILTGSPSMLPLEMASPSWRTEFPTFSTCMVPA